VEGRGKTGRGIALRSLIAASCMFIGRQASADGPASAPEGAATTSIPAAAEAESPAKPQKIRILVLDLKALDVAEPIVRTIQGLVTVELTRYPQLDVISGEDVKRVVELEADKQAIGCADESCLAEIAGAMGAELILFGEVGALGDLKVVNLSLFDTSQMRSVGRSTLQEHKLELLPDKLRPALRELLSSSVMAQEVVAAGGEEADTLSIPTLLLATGAGVAGLGLIGGGIATTLAYLPYQQTAEEIRGFESDGPSALDDAEAAQLQLEEQRTPVQIAMISTGIVVLVGAAVAGVGAVLMLTGGETSEEAGGTP